MAKKPKEKKEPKISCEINGKFLIIKISCKKTFLKWVEQAMDEAEKDGTNFRLTFD